MNSGFHAPINYSAQLFPKKRDATDCKTEFEKCMHMQLCGPTTATSTTFDMSRIHVRCNLYQTFGWAITEVNAERFAPLLP
jgi:hypothetical protein